jgi:hypothetical protein
MKFCYVPQKTHTSRINYHFYPSQNYMKIIHRTGKTKYIRTDGVYDEIFIEDKVDEYEVSLNDITNFIRKQKLPFITEIHFNDDSELCIRLLKHYGTDDERCFEIIFPDWNDINTDCIDNELSNLNSSLNKYEQLIFQWRNHLDEILSQCYNLCNYLDSEYSRINSDIPPLGSPISIRSLKTSIIQNFILYIEVFANFLVEVTISIDQGIPGCRASLHSLEESEIERITERRRYLRLENKLEIAMGMLAHLYNEDYQLNKSSHMWSKFKSLKQKRDALTHIRIKAENTVNILSIDTVIPDLKILDHNLIEGLEIISWFNSQVDELFDYLNLRKNHNNDSFNNYMVVLLFKVVSHINMISANEIIDKQNFSDAVKILATLI